MPAPPLGSLPATVSAIRMVVVGGLSARPRKDEEKLEWHHSLSSEELQPRCRGGPDDCLLIDAFLWRRTRAPASRFEVDNAEATLRLERQGDLAEEPDRIGRGNLHLVIGRDNQGRVQANRQLGIV